MNRERARKGPFLIKKWGEGKELFFLKKRGGADTYFVGGLVEGVVVQLTVHRIYI